MHFLGRKLTFFEGSCIWPKALGGGLAGGSKVYGFGQVCFFWGENCCPLRGLAYGPKPWGGGGLEGQRSMDLDRYAFFGGEN